MTNISTKRIIINKFWVYPVTKSTFYSQYEPYPEEDIIEISSQLRKNLMYVIKKNKLESQEDLKLLVQWKKGKKLIKSYFISL